jgi:hypothetical protein
LIQVNFRTPIRLQDGTSNIGQVAMPYSQAGYLARAEECVRLANMTKDPMLSAELLKLRQSYTIIADRLGAKAERERTQGKDRVE